MKRVYSVLSALLFYAFIFFSQQSVAGQIIQAQKPVVVIAVNEWASQRVLSQAVGTLIKQLGYPVEYQDISVEDQWGALRQGIVHIQVEVWQSSVTDVLVKGLAKRWFEDLGNHDAIGREEWWVPEYVLELCPQLPDWQALNQCASLFASENNPKQGLFFTGPWNARHAELIRALNLDFRIKRLSSAMPLWQKLNYAVENKKPIVLLNWTPNWTDLYVKGQFIKFPQYEPECELNPNWGINNNMTHDCGSPEVSQIKKIAWPGLEQTSPCAYQLLKNIQFSHEMIAKASALKEVEQYSEAQAAQLWLSYYHQQVVTWLPVGCTATSSY
ncbi:ABC transporter substrate-binding protein [Pseudoalteromonas tunicata]|jgi:glycine betaine/proline transport system substrate-binding protein|uniref:Putative ABC transporter, substrate-binding protein n=1 Tax=Pseudoalteromonas tunicata D2 TaxID=87626 RepID=A4CE17_9GAMM|nr:ABC transporter substrate-binding protein [Pseudoalteromonas tunicata]ATC96298.1 glycine betaine/proline transport system substrate-binding protein [Pseudoalteromonas tunicata]AXT31806.1 glycine/betaine ABC transporter substrate-binding protein [Pseudoalteromonas tunicata]EAR27209.1 putative ABC transporter, substrate-binding protein [Pseudoalteromonas tunicata D2]MDP4983932.1 ABC transporter substrate-binding protein [Pseudoalteromonas tunicata]MDP5212212.1 ABC transporter substrate-bindin